MPNDYTRRMPRFNGNKDISIESHMDILWDYMESRGADNEDVYMRALGESLQGDVQLWFDHLAPGSITGYDMFTDLLIDSWSRNTNKILECQSSNDCVVDNQYIDNVLSQLDHSSPDMFQIMSVLAIHKNVTEYFKNNVSIPHVETKKDINQIIRDTLLLLPKAVTEQILDLIHGREPNHHQEASRVEPSICESIKETL